MLPWVEFGEVTGPGDDVSISLVGLVAPDGQMEIEP